MGCGTSSDGYADPVKPAAPVVAPYGPAATGGPGMNDEGAPVAVASSGLYYCGRFLGTSVIPGSDGRCGPTNGPQCPSCQRFQAMAAPGSARSGSGSARSSGVAPAASHVQVIVPEGVVEGSLLRFQTPDGRMIQITVPAGVLPGSTLTIKVPPKVKSEFATLLEAFKYCDPRGTGNITDKEKFAYVAGSFLEDHRSIGSSIVWDELDQDGNGEVNFPEFVEWAQSHNVDLPVGAEESGKMISLPGGWTGRKNDASWNTRLPITDSAHIQDLQHLLEVSFKKIWTRDRKSTGINKVPDRFEFIRAQRSENYKDWKGYYLKRHLLSHHVTSKAFIQRQALTDKAKGLVQRHHLRSYVNEWFLFHGTSHANAEAIARGDFSMALAGDTTGTLYGKGTYFAESITKADEYAKQGPDGECCVLLCRVSGGHVLYNDEVTPNSSELQSKVVSGEYNSILGDREKCRNTYKEYVIFDADQVYVEYIIFYRRVFNDLPS